jgi:hypothetical protein
MTTFRNPRADLGWPWLLYAINKLKLIFSLIDLLSHFALQKHIIIGKKEMRVMINYFSLQFRKF